MSVPKKHHYVPQFLLRHFANSGGRLHVHRTDRDASYPAHVRDVGQTTFGHTLYWPGRPPDHTSLEAGMSDIEGSAAEVITALRASRTRTVAATAREVLGFLIALQWERSRFHIEMVERSVFGDATAADNPARPQGPRQIFQTVLYPWSARADGETDPGEISCYIVDWLQYGPWSWHLYRPAAPKLIIADALVCMWGVADGETSQMPEPWTHHGVSLGFGNCARITMPLAPDLGLIINRATQPRRSTMTAAAFNRATIYNSREFIAHHPDGLPAESLRYALRKDVRTQRWILPIIREATRRAAETLARGLSLPAEQHNHGSSGNPFTAP